MFDLTTVGIEPDGTDENGVTLIKWCAYYGDVSAIRHLELLGADLNQLGPNFDLNAAAFHGHWRLCQYLLERGADVNTVLADTGESPLHSALCKPLRPHYDRVVQVLLDNGANPNVTTIAGCETGAFMRDARTRGETPLHRAAAFGTARVIRMLLDAGADPEARDVNGDSPLTWASWHARPAAVLTMLCFGPHRIHPAAARDDHNDHGSGWGGLEDHLTGRPH